KEPRPEHQRQPRRIGQSARPNLVILVVSELLSHEQDFRRYCCPATSNDVHKLQSIPQQFPDDEHGVEVASPGDLKSKHESFSFAQNGTGFFTNGRKLLEFEPTLIHLTNCRGFCGAQVVQMGRRVNHRTRDINQDVVRSAIAGLKSAGVADHIFLRPLHEYIAPVRADVVRTFGEPLPKGMELESTANCLSSVTALTS